MVLRVALALVVVTSGCGNDDKPEPIVPADYAATYQEVRNCRFSLDHDLLYIRVLASPDALTPYLGRTAPFPLGAIVLKEQYGEDDTTCAGPIVSFTVMEKLEVASSPVALDWNWQEAGADRRARSVNIKSCTSCHTDCGQPSNNGYDGTCTVP